MLSLAPSSRKGELAGVVTCRADRLCRDFTQTQLLEEFYSSLEKTLEGKSSEGSIYIGELHLLARRWETSAQPCMIGTSLRDLVHKFRHRTLVLLKMLMLQKRVSLSEQPPWS